MACIEPLNILASYLLAFTSSYGSNEVYLTQVGEQILSINGQSTSKLSHQQAVNLLKQSKQSVELEVAPADDGSSSANEDTGDEKAAQKYVMALPNPLLL